MQLQYDNKFSEDAVDTLKSLGLNDLQIKFVVYHGSFYIDDEFARSMDEFFEQYNCKVDQFMYEINHARRVAREECTVLSEILVNSEKTDGLNEMMMKMHESSGRPRLQACAADASYRAVENNVIYVEHEIDEKSVAWKEAQKQWK